MLPQWLHDVLVIACICINITLEINIKRCWSNQSYNIYSRGPILLDVARAIPPRCRHPSSMRNINPLPDALVSLVFIVIGELGEPASPGSQLETSPNSSFLVPPSMRSTIDKVHMVLIRSAKIYRYIFFFCSYGFLYWYKTWILCNTSFLWSCWFHQLVLLAPHEFPSYLRHWGELA
jgi:hypothetical protein